MPNGNQSRSDHASREATPRLAIPTLDDLNIMQGVNPFAVGDPEEFSDQGFALLDLLIASFYNSEAIGTEGITRDGLLHENILAHRRPFIVAQALEGVSTLFALSRHFDDRRRVRLSNAELDKWEGR